jgi:beta-galactosidase
MKRSLGVCYYPEQWDEGLWAEDARRMKDLGLTWVRIAEFAWSRMEPEPGRYDWGWLDRAIEVLGAAGLKVVLGTPTATPPRWMLDRHPEMLAVDALGHRRGFGSRRHYDFSHRGYREDCARIVTELARRYGSNPHVQAWQTDNEYACHKTVLSYSPAAQAAFQDWLAQRYQSVDALNRAWGNVFWSMEYRDFAEIGLPNLTVTEPNPAWVMDFRRFASDEVVSFNRLQTEIIRRHSPAPISHNYMGQVTDFDHFATGDDLEIATWDAYPIGFLSDRGFASDAHKRQFLRQGDPDFQAFHHDLYRAVGARRSGGPGRWWVMEQQPGPVNWAPWNPDPLPGMARLWAWEAFAHGAEVVSYFRWRQAPFAQETMHAGILRPDSAPAPAFEEIARIAREIEEIPEVAHAKAPVAIVFDYASDWAWTTQPQGRDFSYFRLVFDTYRAFRRLGLDIDILPPDASDLSAYRIVALPGLATISAPLMAALKAYDGLVLAGPRSNAKTEHFATPLPLPPNLPGLQAVVARVESFPPDVAVPLALGGAFKHWREKVESPHVVEMTQDGFPALVRQGGMHYLCGWADDEALERIASSLAAEAKLKIHRMPEGVRRRSAGDVTFLINYNAHAVTFDGITIPGADVHWSRS